MTTHNEDIKSDWCERAKDEIAQAGQIIAGEFVTQIKQSAENSRITVARFNQSLLDSLKNAYEDYPDSCGNALFS